MRLAEEFNGEIICADSWTVRKEVNIGTSKPTAEDQARIPHHLLDQVEPDEDFTAAVFKDLAKASITDIDSRGKVPIMTGGTGLYIDGVIYDFGFLPAGNRTDRVELNVLSPLELLQKIADLGVELGDVDTGNKRRLIRLIETNGVKPTRQKLRDHTLIIGLKTDREALKERIIKRVDSMLARGLENEVQALASHYGWDCEALKGVGYSQWKDYFIGSQTLPETRQKIIKATNDLAKRQRTWFRRNKSIHWFTNPVNWHDVVDSVTTFLDA